MALDPNIILQSRPQFFDYGAAAERGMGLRSLRNQGLAQDEQLKQAQLAAQKQAKINDLKQGAMVNGVFDPTKYQTGLQNAGYIDESLANQKGYGEVGAQAAATADKVSATQERDFKTQTAKFDRKLQLLSGATDQKTYDSAILQATHENLDVSHLPTKYDAAWVKGATNQLLGAKDALAANVAQQNADTGAARAAEDTRHNRAGEGLTARGQDMTAARAPAVGAFAPRAMPPSAIKQATDAREALRAAESMDATIGNAKKLVTGADGKPPLQTGPFDRFAGAARNYADKGNENSRGLLQLNQIKEKLRSDYLMLAKGVQTEGDAVRAMNAMLPDTNDPAAIIEQLNRLQTQSRVLQQMHAESLATINQEYGRDGVPSQQAPAPAASSGNQPVHINSAAEAAQLAPGTVFITPDGRRKVR